MNNKVKNLKFNFPRKKRKKTFQRKNFFCCLTNFVFNENLSLTWIFERPLFFAYLKDLDSNSNVKPHQKSIQDH